MVYALCPNPSKNIEKQAPNPCPIKKLYPFASKMSLVIAFYTKTAGKNVGREQGNAQKMRFMVDKQEGFALHHGLFSGFFR